MLYLAKCPSTVYFSIWLSLWSPNMFVCGKCDFTWRDVKMLYWRFCASETLIETWDRIRIVKLYFLLTCLRMFRHVYFVLNLVLMWRRWLVHLRIHTVEPVVGKVHRSRTWVKVQIRIVKYYSSKSKSTAFSILLEWKYKSTQFFMYSSKKVLIDRFI